MRYGIENEENVIVIIVGKVMFVFFLMLIF